MILYRIMFQGEKLFSRVFQSRYAASLQCESLYWSGYDCYVEAFRKSFNGPVR